MLSVSSLVVSPCVGGPSLVDPLVDIVSLEPLEATDVVSWQSSLLDHP
jgi:hypothetical protein